MEGARKNAIRKKPRCLPYEQIPAFIQTLRLQEDPSNRMKAVHLAMWGEIDFQNRLWEIPPENDKSKTQNVIAPSTFRNKRFPFF